MSAARAWYTVKMIRKLLILCFQISTQHTEMEKSVLYYISGYVAFREGCSVSAPDIPNENSGFLDRVSRSGLGHPPAELFDLSQYLYAFFKTREKKCCPQVFLDAYQLIYESSGFEIPNIGYIPNSGDSTIAMLKHLQKTSVTS